MMKSIYSKYLLLSLIGVSSLCVDSVAQGGESSADFNPGEINIMPPSPTAGALGQYGLTPVSLSTGTPNISVPLHQISYRGINVPLSLSYSSNGLKVDEVASWVGQGWSLNAGGVITRAIKDEPDEERGGRAIPETLDVGEIETLLFLETAQGDGIDTEPDLYMFNFNGQSGKFVIGDDRMPLIMPAQKLNIGYTENNSLGFADFFIKTPDGLEYIFSDYETSRTYNLGCGKDFNFFSTTAWYLTKIVHPNGAEVIFNYESGITEYYSGVDQTFQERVMQSFKDCGSGYTACGANNSERTCVRKSWVNGMKLKSIIYGSDSTVFTASGRTDVISGKKLNEIKTYVNGNLEKKWTLDHETVTADQLPSGHGGTEVEKRLFLSGFSEWDQDSNESKNYAFEYIDKDNLPARLSFAQDHWGYYNGQNNPHLVPEISGSRFVNIGGSRAPDSNFAGKGMLNKITYPTGGYSQFDYEPNSYWTDNFIVEEFADYELSHVNDEEVQTTFARDTLMINYQYIPERLIFNASVRPSHVGYEFVNCQAIVKIYALVDPDNILTRREFTFSFDSLGQLEYKVFNEGPEDPFMFDPGPYVIEISAREFIQASISFRYKSDETITVKNVEVGGMRIKKETISDGIHSPQVKSYYYAPFENLNNSSMSIPQTPSYFKFITTEMGMVCEGQSGAGEIINGTCKNAYLYSSSQSNLFPISGSHIYYDKVLVADGENFSNGYTEHDFIIYRDANPKVVFGEDITSATYSNIGWNNGLESKVMQKNAAGDVVYQKENEWLIDSASTKNLQGVVIQKKNADWIGEDVYYACNESNTGLDKQDELCWSQYACVTDHKHEYKKLWGAISTKKCQSDSADMRTQYLNCHPCITKNPGDTVIWTKALSHLNVVEYQNYSYRKFLGSTLETTINPDGTQIKKHTAYKYDDPDHMQLTAMESLTSREDTLKTFYYYPSDYDLAEFQHLDTTMFMPALPVRVDQYRADQQTSSTIVKYDTLGQPLEVHKKIDHSQNNTQVANVHIPSSGYTKEVSLTYDSALHVVKCRSPRSGVGESYVWNDEGTLVIGSAINAEVDNFFHTSFEEFPNVSKIGNGSRLGAYFLSDHGFSPSDTTNLVMTYWYYENLEWKFSGELDFANKIHDVNYIDELRVYPKGAQVTTYFYDDYDRLTHVTDPKNRTTSYSYDAFGRLEFVKDHEGHVLSAQEYHYKNSISNQ